MSSFDDFDLDISRVQEGDAASKDATGGLISTIVETGISMLLSCNICLTDGCTEDGGQTCRPQTSLCKR